MGRCDSTLSLLVGVLTVASRLEQRVILRTMYSKMSRPDVKLIFVLGITPDSQDLSFVVLEQTLYNDTVVLDEPENMNEGKTLAFFSYAAIHFADMTHVLKVDDDSFVHVHNLMTSLHRLPRTSLFYGFSIPADDCCFMGGEGYILSQDLVHWVNVTDLPGRIEGLGEDAVTAKWFEKRRKVRHYVSEKYLFYDHPVFGGAWAHPLIDDTILVHQVKTFDMWLDIVQFFFGERNFGPFV